jgi:hypothetical protein
MHRVTLLADGQIGMSCGINSRVKLGFESALQSVVGKRTGNPGTKGVDTKSFENQANQTDLAEVNYERNEVEYKDHDRAGATPAEHAKTESTKQNDIAENPGFVSDKEMPNRVRIPNTRPKPASRKAQDAARAIFCFASIKSLRRGSSVRGRATGVYFGSATRLAIRGLGLNSTAGTAVI